MSLEISRLKNLTPRDFNYAKIKLFTHTDLDGVGCHITFKAMFPYAKIDTDFCDYNNINDRVSEFITREDDISKYDFVYITDLSVNKEVADKINELYRQGILNIALLDHHETALWLNDYDWALVKVKDKINKSSFEKTSGTRMVLDYSVPFPYGRLLGFESNCIINKKMYLLEHFAEIVRKYDTWLWKEYNDLEPKKYNDLLYLIGREDFINSMVNKINKNDGKELEMELSEKDKLILRLEQKRIDKYVDSKEKSMNLFNKFDHMFGVVFAEQYINDVGNTLSERNPDLDFIMVINPNDFKISLRTTREDIKVNDFAKKFGGGGHDKASGFHLDYGSKHFKKIVLGLMEISEANN